MASVTSAEMRRAIELRGDWSKEPHDPSCAHCGGTGEIHDWGPLPCPVCRPWEAAVEILQEFCRAQAAK